VNRQSQRFLLGGVICIAAAFPVYMLFGSDAGSNSPAGDSAEEVGSFGSHRSDSRAHRLETDAPGASSSAAAAGVALHASQHSSFDREADLFKYVTSVADSKEPTLWGHGFMAASNCLVVRSDRSVYERIVESAEAGGTEAAAKKQAAGLLLERCKGFLLNDETAGVGLRRRITDKIRAAPHYVMGVSEGEPTRSQIEDIFLRRDFLSFEKTAVDTVKGAMSAQGVKQGTEIGRDFMIAYLLSVCDLGRDCTSTSLTYAHLCASEGRCAGDLEQVYLVGLSTAELDRVSTFRKKIVHAFVSRDLRFFGLK
jgi:hypothetical protein